MLVAFGLSFLFGFIFYRVFDEWFEIIPASGIIAIVLYFFTGFLANALYGNMLFIALFVLFTPWFAMTVGIDLRTRIIKMRSKEKYSKEQPKEMATEDREKISADAKERAFRRQLDELVRWQDIVGKMHSAPETLTPAERAEIKQFAKDSEPYLGINTIAAIGGLKSWDGEKPQPITQDEIDAMPDSVTVIYACPNCREVHKFDYKKMSAPILRAPDSMNIVGGRLFTTTSHTCSKCNYALTMTLLQCDKCKIGWQPFFYAVHTPPHSSLLLSGTCYMCWEKVRDRSNL